MNLYGLFLSEIADCVAQLKMEKFRAAQIAEWMYKRGITTFADMTNLPLAHRRLLQQHCSTWIARSQAEQHSADGRTSKYLLAFPDGQAIETVLMRQAYGNSVCVSTQIGCSMGCLFCASTLEGMVRNLTGGEMLYQVMHINRQLAVTGQKVDTVVIMGSGEPLLNYEEVIRFIRLCHEPYILGLSYRNFTLSTSGIVPAIDRLARENLPINLAISLHAPNDALRTAIMPVNKLYPLAAVLAAADRYATQSGRRVTYEYTLIANMNDQENHARELASLLTGRLASVNLIPVNPVPEKGLGRPTLKAIACFERILGAAGLTVTVRKEMGADILAACGQLRRVTSHKNPLV